MTPETRVFERGPHCSTSMVDFHGVSRLNNAHECSSCRNSRNITIQIERGSIALCAECFLNQKHAGMMKTNQGWYCWCGMTEDQYKKAKLAVFVNY